MGRTVAVLSYKFWIHPRAVRIAKTLARHGYRVRAWGSRDPVKRGPRFLRGLLNAIFAFFDAAMVRADLYIVENVPDPVYLSLPLFRRKYIYDRRSPWAVELREEFRLPGIVAKLVEVVERFLMKHAAAVITVSTPMLLQYSHWKSKPMVLVPNYPEEEFTCRDTGLREKLGVSPDTKVFIFVSRLSKHEGVDKLPIIAKALEKHNAELWILGDGPGKRLVEAIAKRWSHVRWFGWVPRNKVPEYIAAANYGLVLLDETKASIFYSHEGILKLGEYLKCGKPVIATGVAPSPYIIVISTKNLSEQISRLASKDLGASPPSLRAFPSWEKTSSIQLLNIIELVIKPNFNSF